jgi:hypothetical protein
MKISRFLPISFASLILITGAHSAFGATVTVTNSNDSGSGSLRQAIATAAGGSDTINFDMSTVTSPITLTSELALGKSVTIQGPGATLLTISGGNSVRVFNIADATFVTISGLTITKGKVPSSDPEGANIGGGIKSSGYINITECIVSGNTAGFNHGGGIAVTGPAGSFSAGLSLTDSTVSNNAGGGIFYAASTLQPINLTGSTISGNSTGYGYFGAGILRVEASTISGNAAGGIAHSGEMDILESLISGNSSHGSSDGGGVALTDTRASGNSNPSTIINSTISGNTSEASGGGISATGNTLTITNCTIFGNVAANQGGGIHLIPGMTLNLANTIVAGNNAPAGPDLDGSYPTPQFNLIGKADGSTGFTNGANGNIVGTSAAPVDPRLGPLTNNEGAIQTHALLSRSPAIDKGNNDLAVYFIFFGNHPDPINTDQRGPGYGRIANKTVDIGAFEVQTTTRVVTLTFSVSDASITLGGDDITFLGGINAAVTLRAASPDTEPINAFIIKDHGQKTPTGDYTGTLSQAITFSNGVSTTLSRPVTYSVTSATKILNVAAGDTKTLDLGAGDMIDVTPIAYTLIHDNSPFGVLIVPAFYPNVTFLFTSPSQFLNISTRLRVQTGDNVLIGGFIITGTDPKKVIIRGIGPSLAQFFSGALTDPTLELYQGTTLLASNDNWKTRPDGSSQQAEVEATTIPPTNDLEAAIVRTLDPGAYTAILRGKGDATGIGVVEAYDLTPGTNSKAGNISTRGFVDSGDNVMIGGLIIGGGGGGNSKVVVRAIGPTLGNFGISGALQDPTLELHDGNGTLLVFNNNWQDDASAAEIQADNLAPNDPRESAVLRSLPPGAYTAIVRGSGSTTGIALVEAYNLQ